MPVSEIHGRTIQRYLSDESSGSHVSENDSLLALRAKAATLFERSARVSGKLLLYAIYFELTPRLFFTQPSRDTTRTALRRRHSPSTS